MIVFKTHHQAALVVLAVMLQSVFIDTTQRQKLLFMLFDASIAAIAVAMIHASFMGMGDDPFESVLLFIRVMIAISKTFMKFVLRGYTTKFPNWSLRFEFLHSMIHECTEAYGDRMVIEKNAKWIRAQSDVLGSLLGWFSCHQLKRSLELVYFNGLEHVWLRNNHSREHGDTRLVVVYVHGGGFAILSPRLYTSLGASLASDIEEELTKLSGRDLKVDLLLGNYRKAPSQPDRRMS